jgi:hypothetical protein
MALWINAYNAFTVRLILEWSGGWPGDGSGDRSGDRRGPIDSIKDIPASRRWKDERWEVGGRRYSLDHIEHRILRPLGDARIHFALVCASKGCPDLRAYMPSRLSAQLDAVTRAYLANETKGLRTSSEPGFFFGTDWTLHLSRLFDWFEEDFERDGGSVLDFVERYAPPEARAFIAAHRDELDIDFIDYDWSLNDG